MPAGAVSGHVPEELRTRLHPVWRDDVAVREFCRVYGLNPGPWYGPLTAFRAVAEAYADVHGEGSTRVLGIPMFRCALENRERRGAFYLRLEMTDEDWQFIAATEQRVIA